MAAWQIAIALVVVSVLWGMLAQLAAPERLKSQVQQEYEQAERWIGDERAARMWERASSWVAPIFDSARSNERPELADDFEPAPFAQLRDLEPMLTQATFRVLVMTYVLILAVPFAIGAIIDGIVIRARKREAYQSENPRIYHTAKQALVAVIVAPVVIAMLPIAIGPPLAVAWSAIVVVTVWGMAQNVEQEV